MKKYTLFNLHCKDGWYIATMIDKYGNFVDQSFLYYTKKEVFQLLRNKYNCSVSHKFY